ncbi:MAG TPA: helix-turn-helix transcriptional regulator [Streptosporangiaceae bacterium]|nr:helix-turn-helix transcriptional regulator [Streptosporangiaceae bacterium]
MPERGSPNVRRRRLAAELRRLRERAGLIGEDVAERLGWSTSKLSRIETSKIGVKLDDIRQLLDLYRVGQRHRDELLALARESDRKGRLEAISSHLPEVHAEFLRAEAEAESIWDWEPQVVPGLLQTEEYAREVMLGWTAMFRLPHGEIDRRVEAQHLRQQVLERDPPLALSFVIDESVLHRRLGDASVMRRQLEHIIEVSRLPNVSVRILPLAGQHPVLTGAFTYMRFPRVHDVAFPDVATFEHLAGTEYIEADDDTNKYYVAFQALEDSAYDPDVSRERIASAIREIPAELR